MNSHTFIYHAHLEPFFTESPIGMNLLRSFRNFVSTAEGFTCDEVQDHWTGSYFRGPGFKLTVDLTNPPTNDENPYFCPGRFLLRQRFEAWKQTVAA